MGIQNPIRQSLAVAVILLFVGTSIIPSVASKTVEKPFLPISTGNTLYVGGGGPGNYSSVQEAINNASSGDTVFVFDDSAPYYEHVVIRADKSICLIGEDKNTTIIDGNSVGRVITIKSNNCTVSGFTLINCGDSPQDEWQDSVIRVVSDNNFISNNVLSINELGFGSRIVSAIYLEDSSNNLIEDNILSESDDTGVKIGIFLTGDSSNNIISRNVISRHTYGISTYREFSGSNNYIIENNITKNAAGINLVSGKSNYFLNNTISYNERCGIDLDGNGNIISGNLIAYNGLSSPTEFDSGIICTSDSGNTITRNTIAYNAPTGLYILTSYDNIIEENNFINNGRSENQESFDGSVYFALPWSLFKYFSNKWMSNYYSDNLPIPRVKIILGDLIFFGGLRMSWINIDWHPAKEPYDIGV